MLTLLALFACTDPADHELANTPEDNPAVIPEVAEVVSLPQGAAIFRSACYEQDKTDVRMQKSAPTGGAIGVGRGSGASSSAAGSGSGFPMPPPSAAPPAAMPAKPSADGAAAVATASQSVGNRGGEGSKAKGEALAPAEIPGMSAALAEAEPTLIPDEELAEREYPPHQAGPDWGATLYLSNDDSMSLASAQKLLDALKRGSRFSAAEIRAHELLNYFSFATPTVKRGELFAVSGAAARTDDTTLSLALTVQGASPPRRPLDLTVVVDRSGSMSAEGRMEYLKRGLHQMEGQLRKGDRVDIVLFDHQVCTGLEDFVVGRDDEALLTRAIDGLAPRGSTNLDAGLREGYRLADARHEQGREQRVMLITDAQMNTGNVDEHLVSEVARHFEEHEIRLTGVGVGRDFRDDVLDRLTEKGKGAYVYLGSEAVVDRIFGAGFQSLTQTLAHDVHFALDLPDSLAMERFYGEEVSTVKEDVQPIHYYAGTSQVFLQDLKVNPQTIKPTDPVTMHITWTDPTTGEPGEQTVAWRLGELVEAPSANLDKARALMAWTDVLMAKATRQDPCGAPLTTFSERASKVAEDPEIAYVSGLVTGLCPRYQLAPAKPTTVPLKVKLSSDKPLSSAELRCGPQRQVQALSPSDSVARFEATPGACVLLVEGAGTWTASLSVPSVATELRCTLAGDALRCN
ncbi:MAG: VWA domain-containing protein [Deltaproteobacteria bacterium]|nr:VWA domain-containing protein [Deltaproteobacteria bacterium]